MIIINILCKVLLFYVECKKCWHNALADSSLASPNQFWNRCLVRTRVDACLVNFLYKGTYLGYVCFIVVFSQSHDSIMHSCSEHTKVDLYLTKNLHILTYFIFPSYTPTDPLYVSMQYKYIFIRFLNLISVTLL